jgi:hypothetical protein
MYGNIKKYVLQHQKHVLQLQKLCAATSKIIYCNISSSSTVTLQKHLLQRPKNHITIFKNHLLQHKKTYYNTGETKKGVQNSPWSITFEFTGGWKE